MKRRNETPLLDLRCAIFDPSQLPRALKVLAELEKLARISQNPLNSSLPLNKAASSLLKGTIVTGTSHLCPPRSWSLSLTSPGGQQTPEAGTVLGMGAHADALKYGAMLLLDKRNNFSQCQRYRLLIGRWDL